jgi:hypothetical protein
MSMKPDGRHDHRGTAHLRADEVEMDTFRLQLPRWPVLLRLLGRDPLVRTADRVEALVLTLAVVVCLLAIPISAAIGTVAYDSLHHRYAEQANTRHTVTATVTDVPASEPFSRTGMTTVQARWFSADTEHTGSVEAQSATEVGAPVEIWVDDSGEQATAPVPTNRSAVEAVMSALAVWISVAAIAATLCAVTQALCDRTRYGTWDRELDSLTPNGNGHQHPGRPSER